MTGSTASAAEPTEALRRSGGVALVLAASEILSKVATLAFFSAAARLLGSAEFGVFAYGLGLGLLLSVCFSGGMDARLVQLGSAFPGLLARTFGAVLILRTAISVLVMVACIAVAFVTGAPGERSLAMLMLICACLLDTYNDAVRAACGAVHRQGLCAYVVVAQRFLALPLGIGLLLFLSDRDAWGAALGYLLSMALSVVAMFVVARRAGVSPDFQGCSAQVRPVLAAVPVLGSETIATTGLFRLDSALIGVMLGAVSVGVYSASYRIFESALFVSWTLSRVCVPIVASRPDDIAHVGAWSRRSLVVVIGLYLPYGVALALRGDDLVGVLFGESFVMHGLMLALAFSPLLFGLAHMSGTLLMALRPDPRVLVASIAALVVNLALNLALIPRWGIIGAAVTTSTSFLVQTAIGIAALRRVVDGAFPPRPIAVIVLASAAAGGIAVAVAPVLPALVASAATYVVVWVLLCRWLDPHNWSALLAVVRRRGVGSGNEATVGLA